MVISTLINSFSVGTGGAPALALGAWKEIGRTTLGSAGDLITVATLPNVKHFMTLCHNIATGNVSLNFRFNADADTNYATRRSFDDGADTTAVNGSEVDEGFGGDFPKFDVGFVTNILNKEIMQQHNFVYQDTAVSSTDPRRAELIGKWDNMVDPVDEIAAFNDSAGSFNTNSELVVLGWDETNTHTTTDSFWQPVGYTEVSGEDTTMLVSFTPKKYLWMQMFLKNTTGTYAPKIRFNGDTATNYSFTNNFNGSGDTPAVTQDHIAPSGSSTSDNRVFDMWLLNEATAIKLFHSIDIHASAAGVTPQRTETNGKWVETTDAISEILVYNTGTSDFGTGSYIQVWGAD